MVVRNQVSALYGVIQSRNDGRNNTETVNMISLVSLFCVLLMDQPTEEYYYVPKCCIGRNVHRYDK